MRITSIARSASSTKTMESLTKAAIARNPEMLNDELVREIAALLTRYLRRA